MSRSDMFLGLTGQKTGPIKGESEDEKHLEEIDILGWSWGIASQREMASGQSIKRKAEMKELRVRKHVDRSSTALMSVATNNELIKKAVLMVRKAGTTQQEFFKLTIEEGRITSYEVEGPESETSPEMLESLTFSFRKIEVEYRLQGEDGQLKGSSSYLNEIGE